MSGPHVILKQTFGFDHFRGTQEEVIERVLAGQHTLAVMPTDSRPRTTATRMASRVI